MARHAETHCYHKLGVLGQLGASAPGGNGATLRPSGELASGHWQSGPRTLTVGSHFWASGSGASSGRRRMTSRLVRADNEREPPRAISGFH